jgi:hypothetical protein
MYMGDDDAAKQHLRSAIEQAQRQQVHDAVEALERRRAVRAVTPSELLEEGYARNLANRLIGDELRGRGARSLGDLDPDAAADVVRRAGGRAVADAEDHALHARIQRMATARASHRCERLPADSDAVGAADNSRPTSGASASGVIARMSAFRRAGRNA